MLAIVLISFYATRNFCARRSLKIGSCMFQEDIEILTQSLSNTKKKYSEMQFNLLQYHFLTQNIYNSCAKVCRNHQQVQRCPRIPSVFPKLEAHADKGKLFNLQKLPLSALWIYILLHPGFFLTSFGNMAAVWRQNSWPTISIVESNYAYSWDEFQLTLWVVR